MSTLRPAALAIVILSGVIACGRTDVPGAGQLPEPAMVFIEGGSFRMGTDESELASVAARIGLESIRPLTPEVPAHEVSVSDFYMDRYDVTNADFHDFVQAAPAWRQGALAADQHNGRYLEHWVDGEPPVELSDHPVVFITWHSAVAFCAWKGKRLPTEVEYEWAAQSGVDESDFPWGNELPDNERVNWGGNDIDSTTPVGSYEPNPRGLYDMSGNVWHFTDSPWLGSYAEEQPNPDALATAAGDPDIRRVVRGGSFGANAANLRVRYRDSHRPYDAREMVGFRCARSAG